MTDAPAYPLLMDAMRAASITDANAFAAALDAATVVLSHPGHRSHAEIAAARAAAERGEWDAAWLKAHHAICALVWVLPPDFSVCPPNPSDRAAMSACPECAALAHPCANFCHACGSLVGASR